MYTFRFVAHDELNTIAPRLFRILSENMGAIAPTGNSYDEDYRIWSSYVLSPAFWENDRRIILMLSGGEIAGYLQYSQTGSVLTIDEIEIDKKYQRTMLFGKLLHFAKKHMPSEITDIEAYVNKGNLNSKRITEKLGLSIIGENKSGKSWHYRGKCENLFERVR